MACAGCSTAAGRPAVHPVAQQPSTEAVEPAPGTAPAQRPPAPAAAAKPATDAGNHSPGPPARPPVPPPPSDLPAWDVPAAPAVNYLAGPGTVVSVDPGTSSSQAATASPGAPLRAFLHVRGLLAAAAADPKGGVWYVADPPDGTLLWSDGRQVRVVTWRGAAPAGPVRDISLTAAPDGGAWLMLVAPTVPGATPGNLLGLGDAGGRAVAVHALPGGGSQAYPLPPLVGSDVTGFAVAPDGRLWFCTSDANGTVRSLYAYDPLRRAAQPYPLPVLGRVLDLTVTQAGVWLHAALPGQAPDLFQLDPTSGALARVLRRVTAAAAAPDGSLFAAVRDRAGGRVYRFDAAGDRVPGTVLQLQQPAVGLAASPGSLWVLTAGRLYRMAR